jgi:uncharacterized repeat protein (TIGR04076 family)
MTAVKITVLKRALYEELSKTYRGGDAFIRPCEVFTDGQEFICGLNMPDGFCGWAWQDINRMVLALLGGGSFNKGTFRGWMKDDNNVVTCCTDGLRPVSFLLERIDTRSLIKTSKIERPAPPEAYESERWGEFSYAFPGLDPGARYKVRLHFCEVYHTSPDKRRFSVQSSGMKLFEDFDIFAMAGGAFKPIIREFEAAADKSGALVLNFIRGAVDYPKVSAIEIIPSAAGSAGKPVYAINAGGSAFGDFSADRFFTGGNVASG